MSPVKSTVLLCKGVLGLSPTDNDDDLLTDLINKMIHFKYTARFIYIESFAIGLISFELLEDSLDRFAVHFSLRTTENYEGWDIQYSK